MGLPTDLWTCQRVARVIKKELDAQYDLEHVSRILKAMRFSYQKPAKRARERGDRAVEEFLPSYGPALNPVEHV